MKRIITFIAITGLVIISPKIFSQNTDSSSHPLLDKYYPQPKQPANDNTPQTKKTTSLTPATQTKAPVSSTSVSNNAPTLPVSNTDPGPEPETTAAHSISKDSSVTATPSASATTIVTKPTVITNTTPVQQTQQKSYDPNSLYDTRLGSSSPQYDTYEKNSYGAGTVTTSPK